MATTRRYAGISAEDRQAARREQLLRAARKLFATGGLAKLTVTGVCAQARLTERYFYENFANRDALIDELFATIATQEAVEIFAAAAAGPQDPHERMRRVVATTIDLLTADSMLGRMVGEMKTNDTLARHRGAVTRNIADLSGEYAHVVLGPIAHDSTEIRMAIQFVIAGAIELVIDWLNGTLTIPREQLIDTCTNLVLAAGNAVAQQTPAEPA